MDPTGHRRIVHEAAGTVIKRLQKGAHCIVHRALKGGRAVAGPAGHADFPCSADSDFVTGPSLVVDGGSVNIPASIDPVHPPLPPGVDPVLALGT